MLGNYKSTYQLIVANDSHDTQGFDSVLTRVEVGESSSGTDISKDNIGVDIGIEIIDSFAIRRDYVCKGRDALGVPGSTTAPIVFWTTLLAVAVDVHISQVTTSTLNVDNIIV